MGFYIRIGKRLQCRNPATGFRNDDGRIGEIGTKREIQSQVVFRHICHTTEQDVTCVLTFQ
jgi:hypothetical protein